MFLQLQQQSLLLGRRPTGFTEHYYTEWDDGLGKDKIALFLLISVSSTHVPSAEIAKEAFQLLQDHFLDDLSGDAYERFENALREINLMVTGKEKELEVKFLPNVHTVIGVVQGDHLYLSQRGEAHGYLLRKRHVSSITEGLFDEKNKEDLFQNIASGILEVGDDVLFVTGPLVQYVTPTDLAKIFSEQSLEQATRELESILRHDVEDQMAMLSFEVLEKTEELRTPLKADATQGQEEVEEKRGLNPSMQQEIPRSSVSESGNHGKERFSRAVSLLQDFAENQEGLKVLKGVRFWEKKKLLMAMGVLVLVGVLGLSLLSSTIGKQREINAMNSQLSQAREYFVQAQTEGVFNKEDAAVLLADAQALLTEVMESGYLESEASELLEDIANELDYLDNVYHVSDGELKEIADFSEQLTGGGQIVGVESYGDRLVVFSDTQSFQVLTDQVQDPKLIDSTDKVIVARAFPDYNAIVLLTFGGKLMEFTDGNSQFADTVDVNWQSGVDVATYSNKIYILDPSNDQIWKYQRGNSGYGGASAYLPEGEDLGKAVSFAIDGKIWVLQEDGTLLQYLSGEKLTYTLKKAPLTRIEGATRVLTSLEMTQLFVLDSAGGRVLVYDKSSKNDDLTYASQYAFDSLKETITDIHLDQDRNVLMFTTSTKLYEVEVKED